MSLLMTHPAIPTYIYCYLGELGCLVFWLGPRLLLLSFQSFAFNSTLLTQKGGFFFPAPACCLIISLPLLGFQVPPRSPPEQGRSRRPSLDVEASRRSQYGSKPDTAASSTSVCSGKEDHWAFMLCVLLSNTDSTIFFMVFFIYSIIFFSFGWLRKFPFTAYFSTSSPESNFPETYLFGWCVYSDSRRIMEGCVGRDWCRSQKGQRKKSKAQIQEGSEPWTEDRRRSHLIGFTSQLHILFVCNELRSNHLKKHTLVKCCVVS